MNPTTDTIQQSEAMETLKEAVLLLLKRHEGEAYTGWSGADHKRLQRCVDLLEFGEEVSALLGKLEWEARETADPVEVALDGGDTVSAQWHGDAYTYATNSTAKYTYGLTNRRKVLEFIGERVNA